MPSSLMARLKATQGNVQTPASGGRSRVVSPPPESSSSLSSSRRPSSSLAAAATAAAASQRHATSNDTNRFADTNPAKESSGYVPQFKKNPLNANVVVATFADERAIAIENETTSTAKSTKDETYNNAIMSPPSSSTSPSAAEAPAKKTLIRQLLQHKKESSIIPPPYSMCSESEALDRQHHLELSPLECNPGTIRSGIISTVSSSSSSPPPSSSSSNYDERRRRMMQPNSMGSESPASHKAARHRPTFNPHYVIKKYRRSAAGGGALSEASDKCPRTLDQLNKTVDYLLGNVFVHQMPPPTTVEEVDSSRDGSKDNVDTRNADPNEISIWGEDTITPVKQRTSSQQNQQQQEHTPFSFSDTVSFIDDRLRAVQKDLVTLLGNALEVPNNNASSLDKNNNSNYASAKRNQVKQQRTKQTVREMQAKMIRYNILASYLLSDVPPSKYEVKFGARALRTSLTCYLNLSTSLHDQYSKMSNNFNDSTSQQQSQYKKECQTQDEIMAYMALLHSSAVLRSEETALPPPTSGEMTSSLMEDSGSGWGALLSTFCKHVLEDDEGAAAATAAGQYPLSSARTAQGGGGGGMVEKYPRWKWALELACVAQVGNYQRYFSLLEKGPVLISSSLASTPASVADEEKMMEADNARFLILARCCASHSLTLVRLAQVRRYNRVFGKGENVSAKDLTRLLRLGTYGEGDEGEEILGIAERAIGLCRDAGLPIVEKEKGSEQKELFVTMKSASINITGEEAIWRICNPGRMNDSFVFGSRLSTDAGDGGNAVESLAGQLSQQCGIQEDVDDWEERDGNENNSKIEKSITRGDGFKSNNFGGRNDEDGVSIPPSSVIKNLIE